MNKELKKQIKHDELRDGLGQAAGWIDTHRDEVRMGAIAIAVVLLAAIGFGSWRSHRAASAEKAFDQAITIFHSPVAGDPEALQVGETVYPSRSEKYAKAAAAFDEIVKQHGSTSVGARARYYAALSRIEMGQTQAAEAELAKLSSDGDALVKGLARLALADLHRGAGRWDQAIEGYRKIIDDSGSTVPRDHALMRLAGTLEDARRAPDALASYRRLVEEFPSSVYVAEARRRADVLSGKA
jgi:tetratricopeptide (TPR) repeat protein